MLLLDSEGRFVHGFRAYSTGGRNPTYLKEEFAKGLEKLKLAAAEPRLADTLDGLRLPDVKGTGVRLYIRSGKGRPIIVEAVEMSADLRNSLRLPEREIEIDADALRSWLAQIYPSAIRAAEQQKSFKKAASPLKLRPAAGAGKLRYAILSGPIRLTGNEGDSSLNGTLEAVLTYATDTAELRALRGIVEGTYDYRVHQRKAGQIKVSAAIESRPE